MRRISLLPIVPLVALAAGIVALYLWGPSRSHESAVLLLVLNAVFTTLVSIFIAILAGRSFLATGRLELLAITVGMTIWGISAFVAVVGEHVGNYNLTIHNLGVAASGLCHLAGAAIALRFVDRPVRDVGAWLSCGVAMAFSVIGLIWLGTLEGWLPPFFVEGTGSTPLRNVVLTTSIGMFAIAAALIWQRYRLSNWQLLLWYSLGLGLIAVGALGLMLQPTHGSWLGWLARAAQYSGGVYMLIGTFISVRDSGGWEFSLEERLIQSEQARREQADLIRAVNDATSELIFVKDVAGRLTYANAATLRAFGIDALPQGTTNRELFRSEKELIAISQNDARVLDSGHAMEFEEVFTGADGIPRTYVSTKTPLRDSSGAVVGVVGVSRDLTERLVAQEQLRTALATAEEASAALREASVRKDEFLAMLAHELRNPLAPLRNALETIKLTAANPEILMRSVGMMDRQVQQLVRLVDDLIDVSRITRNKIELRCEPLDLAAVLRDAVEACTPLITASRQDLRLSLPPQPLVVHGDRVRLTQVFSNLLNNACKYSEPGGVIELFAGRSAARVQVIVSDRGIGIPEAELGRIFDFFMQVDRSLERAQGGLGIGLTLVKRLVELHGGSVTAHSAGIGQGSRFVVELPVSSSIVATPDAQPMTSTSASSRRVLVVDDNEDSATSLVVLLKMAGHVTDVAHDGLEAIEVAERFRPDVVLLDIGLPKLNGYETCRRLRALPFGNDMRIVALTGWGQQSDRSKSHAAGFDQHIVKPVSFETLSELLSPGRIRPLPVAQRS